MILQKNIKLLMWFNFFTDLSFYGPIAIIYFSRIIHSYTLGSIIIAITYISASLFDIPAGIYSDQIGRKRSIILGATFAVGYAVFYAIGINFWILAIGSVIQGLSRAFYSGNNDALLHTMLSEEGLVDQFHIYSGKLTSVFQIALTISGLLSGIIAYISFPLAVWLSVIPQVACLIISLYIIDTTIIDTDSNNILTHLKEAIKAFVHTSNLRLLSISSILGFGLGEFGYQFQAAFFNSVLPLWAVGIAKMLTNLFATISFYFSSKIIDRFSSIRFLLFNDVYNFVVNIIALIFPTAISPFLMASTSLLYGPGRTATNTLLQKEFTDKQRATMSSLNSFGGSLFFGILAFLGGAIADKVGPAKTLLAISILTLSVLWFHWKFYKLANSKNS